MLSIAQHKVNTVTHLLNGTVSSLQKTIPLNLDIEKPRLLETPLKMIFGVLVGITGDFKGKLVLSGEPGVFSIIGEAMFGMPLDGDMLPSFSGELGNMIAGRLSTSIYEDGIKTDITSPTIMQGDTTISGFKSAVHLSASFESAGKMEIHLLLD
ncbi:chemotaxis protein CheX [Ammoniphilus resinae]|uniref:Chemotaxis protein CheX n=1 Tax=Ammoniphilus resinae TaxID=861532 RepID=A0ABS4GMM1_9BACL|nr:chemotaxis protein CheX [Ammoniphilus resinae]MBP1931486.1 chemotaxis protein CheX [Ammoniphilus resinae]